MSVYKGRLLKKSRPVNAGHYTAFKYRISFATNLAAHFGSNRYWNLSRRPFLGQVVNLDLLLCTGFDLEHVICSYVIFLLRDQ